MHASRGLGNSEASLLWWGGRRNLFLPGSSHNFLAHLIILLLGYFPLIFQGSQPLQFLVLDLFSRGAHFLGAERLQTNFNFRRLLSGVEPRWLRQCHSRWPPPARKSPSTAALDGSLDVNFLAFIPLPGNFHGVVIFSFHRDGCRRFVTKVSIYKQVGVSGVGRDADVLGGPVNNRGAPVQGDEQKDDKQSLEEVS